MPARTLTCRVIVDGSIRCGNEAVPDAVCCAEHISDECAAPTHVSVLAMTARR